MTALQLIVILLNETMMRSQQPALHWNTPLPCGTTHTLGFHLVLFTESTLQIHFNIFVTLEGSINSGIGSIHAATVASRVLQMPLWTRSSYLYIYCTINIIPQPIFFFFLVFLPRFPGSGGATVATRSPLQIQRTRP